MWVSKSDIHYLYEKLEKNLHELNEESLDYIKNEEESVIESFLNK